LPTSPSWGSRKRCQGQLTQGQLTQVTQVKTGTTTLASNASYYPNGALAQFTYGNGIAHTMTQNARQLPSHSVDGSVLDLSTVFDENGNVAAITDNTASARQTRSMSYDGLDRLTATTSPMFGTASYAYDPQDNLTRVQVTGGSQPRDHYYCYNASNQLAFVRSGPNCTGTTSPAVIALAYDVQGNLSIKNGASYAFDFGNRLRTTAGQNYRYDAQGRRVRQDVAGSQLQYSQYAADGRLVWQRDETTNQRIANAYLAGSLLAEISRPLTGSTTTIRYLHTDALGSPIAKTSASGAIIETSEYEPYGRLLNRANDNRAGYTGHVMDAASGLTYMQQRYYDPAIGAFLSVDPVTAYSNPVGAFSRYRYANGNPYRFTDPDGRLVEDSVQDSVRRTPEERISRRLEDLRGTVYLSKDGHGDSSKGGDEPQIPLAGSLVELLRNTLERVVRRTSVSVDAAAALGIGVEGHATKTTRRWQHDSLAANLVVGVGTYLGVSGNYRVFSWGPERGSSGLGVAGGASPAHFRLKGGLGASAGLDIQMNDRGGGSFGINLGLGFGEEAVFKLPTSPSWGREL